MGLKYRDPKTGQFKEISVKINDTLPIGTVVSYTGLNAPTGWESYTTDDAYAQTTLWHTTSWNNMLTPNTVKSLDMSPYDYVEVTFTGQGGTN